MSIHDLHVGSEVFWNDPDAGICSGWYTIEEVVNDEVLRLRNEAGSEVEVYVQELS